MLLNRLRNNLSEKLPDVSMGVSSWVTVLPISSFGLKLLKQHFWNAVRLRYD